MAQPEESHLQGKERGPRRNHPDTCEKIKFCSSKPPSRWYFVMADQADWSHYLDGTKDLVIPKMLCAQVGTEVQKGFPLCSGPVLSFHPTLHTCLSEFPELLGALAPSAAPCPCWAGRCDWASSSPSPASASTWGWSFAGNPWASFPWRSASAVSPTRVLPALPSNRRC